MVQNHRLFYAIYRVKKYVNTIENRLDDNSQFLVLAKKHNAKYHIY